jgi:hypothetical protein
VWALGRVDGKNVFVPFSSGRSINIHI